ncbi:MAG: 2-amino-4-hydroxy-6-hydroxymethyldihydropteridine diphosphokinase [Phycisphaerae bacterium]
MKREVYISLGSNLGEREGNIRKAALLLGKLCGGKMRLSSVIETNALSNPSHPPYLNAAAAITTSMPPEALLACAQEIEHRLGRERNERWGPRTIDIDIIFYGNAILDNPTLTIPHPQAHLRAFVMEPLRELAPDFIHPQLGLSVSEMATALRGMSFYHSERAPKIVHIAGNIASGKTTLAKQLSAALGTELVLEDKQRNPFLASAVRGRADLNLNSELYFLDDFRRKLDPHSLRPSSIYITDYFPEQMLVFAQHSLPLSERLIHSEQYERVLFSQHRPALLIYLRCPDEICERRMRERTNAENRRPASELLELAAEYDTITSRWRKTPVLTFDCGLCDFRSAAEIDKIAIITAAYLRSAQ